MSDTAKLITEARAWYDDWRGDRRQSIVRELTDALDAAEAENRRLREALQEIAAYEDDCIHQRQARAALAGSGDE